MIKLSNEEFKNRVHKANENLLLLEPFNGFTTKLRCKCLIHNTEFISNPTSLIKGIGCKKCKKENRIKSIVGNRYGRLLVLKMSEKTSGVRKKIMYVCQCDCGNIVDILSESLKNGTTMSCGCLYKETRGMNKKCNSYNLTDYEYGVGYCDNGTSFIFDKEDYDKIKSYSWWYDGRYVVAHSHKNDHFNTSVIRMHRVVLDLNIYDDYEVDHINLIRYDNRKKNLRQCNHTENSRNKELSHLSSTGVTGVRKTNSGKWNSSIRYNYKNHNLGNFNNFEDAVNVRKMAEEKYFGEFALNMDLINENLLM